MKREILILSAILISFSSHADSWESITKSTYQDSAMSKEKRVNNPDGSYLKSVYYIDSAMQLAACEGAKKSAESVFEQMIPLYEDTWPNSKFRLVFDGDCKYDGTPAEKDVRWLLKASVVGDMQRLIKDENPSEPTPEEICAAKSPEEGVFNNVYSNDGNRYIYYNGCEYEATGVIVCQGDGAVCAATWKPTGTVADPSDKPSSPAGDDGDTGGGDTGGGDTGGGDTGGSGSGGSHLSKGDIQSAIEDASPKIATDIHDKLTEKDTSADDQKQADQQTQNNINRLDDSINNLARGAGNFADPNNDVGHYGEGDSDLDLAISQAKNQFGIDKDSHGASWDVFLNNDSIRPSIPTGNGCSDFIMFSGAVYQLEIGCDKLGDIKSMLSWVMYCLTFWYVFSSITSLLRKGE